MRTADISIVMVCSSSHLLHPFDQEVPFSLYGIFITPYPRAVYRGTCFFFYMLNSEAAEYCNLQGKGHLMKWFEKVTKDQSFQKKYTKGMKERIRLHNRNATQIRKLTIFSNSFSLLQKRKLKDPRLCSLEGEDVVMVCMLRKQSFSPGSQGQSEERERREVPQTYLS